MADLVHKLIFKSADRLSDTEALAHQGKRTDYAALAGVVDSMGKAMLALGLDRHERVAVYLEKRPETVIALFAAAAAVDTRSAFDRREGVHQ